MPTLEDAQRLVVLADERDPEFGTYLRLTLATGLRRGELCGLRWCDFDPQDSTLLVSRAIVGIRDHGVQEKDTKTHASRRSRV